MGRLSRAAKGGIVRRVARLANLSFFWSMALICALLLYREDGRFAVSVILPVALGCTVVNIGATTASSRRWRIIWTLPALAANFLFMCVAVSVGLGSGEGIISPAVGVAFTALAVIDVLAVVSNWCVRQRYGSGTAGGI